METRKCPKCSGTMHHSSDMENPFAGTENKTPFWQCEDCGATEDENTMETTAKHTATPWQMGDEYDHRRDELIDPDGRCIALVWTRRPQVPNATARIQFHTDPELQANAEFIVRACNCHDELVDVCRDALNERIKQFHDPAQDALCLRLQAIIARATGRKEGE